ncbi:ABC transporter permease [Rubrobacter calidifluminis]|uniref:ABC transporter permease n=1 Tax=Rubrobacter calidifluminis TaxID=1392640 RepID=UPI00236188AB|nr:ABC transporter permease [Rubrobacter calidifluminis]
MTDPAGTSRAAIAEGALRSALSSRERPQRPNVLSASLTFAWRALLKIKHVPEQLFDAVGNPIIFTLLFTYLLGGAMAGSPGAYLQFLIPGILVQTVLLITSYTGFNLNTDISKGVADRFRSMPIWRPAVIVGALLGDMVRYTLASLIVLLLGLILGFRPESVPGVLLSLVLILVFAFSVSWIWTTLGLVARTPNTVLWVSTLITFPLTFASNIFVEPKTMPGWLQSFVAFNPVTHLVTAVRGLMSGTLPAGDSAWLLVGCAVLVTVFAPATMYLYGRRG